MKNVMCIVAVVMSLIGSANLAMALPDDGVVTGSQAGIPTRAPTVANTSFTAK